MTTKRKQDEAERVEHVPRAPAAPPPPPPPMVPTTAPANALQQLHSAEIDQQIATAKRYPRSLETFYRDARTLTTANPTVAEACTYVLKRKDSDGGTKRITGPSARFAEIIASQWTNCRYGARIVGEDHEFVTAQGVFNDLEKNVAVTFEIKRRIVDSKGRRYSVDMVGVTGNAACSIALRNAVFKGIPKAIWEPIHAEAMRVARGDLATLANRRTDMLAKFAAIGVKPEEIFTVLGIKGVADVGLDELLELGGLYTAIADGDTTVDLVFRARAPEGPAASAEEPLNAALGLEGEHAAQAQTE